MAVVPIGMPGMSPGISAMNSQDGMNWFKNSRLKGHKIGLKPRCCSDR